MAGLYEEEILGAQQSRDLARKLRDTEVPSTGHMIGDWYVAPTVAQQLSAVLKQGIGAYKENQAEDEIKDLRNQRLKDVISAKQGLGIPASQRELEAAGTPAQKPSVFSRIGGALGIIDEPKGTPAVPMQQPPVANFETLTPAQQAMAMSNAAGIIPTEAAAYMAINEHQATRDALKQKQLDDIALHKELQTEKLEAQKQIAADRNALLKAIADSRPQPQGSVVTFDDPNDSTRQIKMDTQTGKIYGYEAKQKAISPQQQQKMDVDAGEEASTASALFSKVNEIQKASHELKTSPGLPGISGYRGIVPNLPESEASLAQNKYDSLMGKITSLGKDVAASSGAVGNMAVQEWGILRDTIAKIDPVKLGTKKTIEALDEVDASLNRLGSRTQQAYERTYQPVIEQDPKRFGLKFQPYQPQTTKVNDVQSEADAILGRK
jgi:hypothetical protein